ncbi:MAG: helix-turn-helix domain-containing protein [Pseudonocardiaceae bacterium]|nr:helix-turn-helix domain-containing protein [Pseudonocardiaceae bacterium]
MRPPISETSAEFGRRVAEARRRAGMGQEKCARRARVHVTMLSSIERGRRNPGMYNIVKIASAIGIPPGDLLNDLPPPPAEQDDTND